jgi:hypothetical protein
VKQPIDGETCFSFMFGGLPTLTLHFGDSPKGSVVSDIFERDMSASLKTLGLHEQKQFAAELYPVMVKRFSLEFPRSLDAEGLFDFLNENDEAIGYLYETAFCSAETYSHLFKELTEKAQLNQGVNAEIEGNQLFWFPVKAGQCLTVVHFGLVRMPGKRAVA